MLNVSNTASIVLQGKIVHDVIPIVKQYLLMESARFNFARKMNTLIQNLTHASPVTPLACPVKVLKPINAILAD